MFLNEFALGLAPKDMSVTSEFASLLQSAADLNVPHDADVRYHSRQTVVRGLRFHFSEWGDPAAPPVLLLHGGNQSSHSWDLVSLYLAERYHVYALDQRGHGDSEWSHEVDYSMEAMAADALAFVQDQHIDAPIVFGHSMGGYVTMYAARQSPTFARAIVFVDVGPELSVEGRQVVRDFVVHNVEFDDLDTYLDAVSKYDQFRSREHISRTAKYNLLSRADGKIVSKADHRRYDPSNPGQITPSTGFELEEAARIACPTLVVRGGESAVFTNDAAVRFVDVLPQGQLVTVPNVGHNVHSGNTLGFIEVIDPFLASLS